MSSGVYGHPARTLIPIRPVAELLDAEVIIDGNLLPLLRRDRLVNYDELGPVPEAGERAS